MKELRLAKKVRKSQSTVLTRMFSGAIGNFEDPSKPHMFERRQSNMFVGDLNRIDVTSNFERIIKSGCLYVDKTRFIEHFLYESYQVQIIARQRRLGKSLNMDMLHKFLTDSKDCRGLFEGLYIRSSSVWKMVNSAPAFLFNFKDLPKSGFLQAVQNMVNEYAEPYAKSKICPEALRDQYKRMRVSPDQNCIGFLTHLVYAVTGKCSYILIDEYDNLIMNCINSEMYSSVLEGLTAVLSAGLKDNNYLEKGLLTGVTRVSHESGLNNPETYDVFDDDVYVDDYGLTELEVKDLCAASGAKLKTMKEWYNGIRIGGKDIYNTFSVLKAVGKKKYDCYWGKSGAMDLITEITSPVQKAEMMEFLNKEKALEISLEDRLNPVQLVLGCTSRILYSYLVQSGYLALNKWNGSIGVVSVPNKELRRVWEKFIFAAFFPESSSSLPKIFFPVEPSSIANKLEDYIIPALNRLSFHNLPTHKCEDGKRRVDETYYHNTIYGMLYSGRELLKFKEDDLVSNMKNGNGRFDIKLILNGVCYIIEFKSAAEDEDLLARAQFGLNQIVDRKYHSGVKIPVIGIGCSFCKKESKVVSSWLSNI
jgi:hypothetical protein